jgi:signal recognition particle receptor subunit alpha
LTYISDLLSRSKSLFLSLFQQSIQALVLSLSSTSTSQQSQQATEEANVQIDQALSRLKRELVGERWEEIWERCLRGCEERADGKKMGGKAKKSSNANNQAAQKEAVQQDNDGDKTASQPDQTGLSAEEIAKNVQAFKNRMKTTSSGRSSPALNGGTASPGKNGRPAQTKRTSTANAGAEKIMRKWGNGTGEVTPDAMKELDFSGPDLRDEQEKEGKVDVDGLVDRGSLGQVGKEGFYEVADWNVGKGSSNNVNKEELPSEEEILARGRRLGGSGNAAAKTDNPEDPQEPISRLSSLFNRLTGKKVLSESDLDPVLREMEKHLMSKNVAKDIAEKLCEGVGKALVGKKLGGMTSVRHEVNNALSTTITQVLSPKTSTDILLDIKRKASQPLPPSVSSDPNATPKRDPYTMTFVGVNGVGKSTNLSKVAFWLLQNKLRVLIAACDTFRSGAVEQLRVHVRNLGLLESQLGVGRAGEGKLVELYERGYGKDAAGIAKDAIAHGESLRRDGIKSNSFAGRLTYVTNVSLVAAKENGYDVVLIDTAGRMQDNEPLMRALAKLVTVNNPDKIVFVGEALVGNEAVDQLSKFDRSLKDFSAAAFGVRGKARGIDGMILTKFDTIVSRFGDLQYHIREGQSD